MSVSANAYLSPTLVLLAFDWPKGGEVDDFLGFAIRRSPGFDVHGNQQNAPAWLPNRIGFNGPPAQGQPDFPTNEAPVQKFMWWDSRLAGLNPGAELTYEIIPVTGTPGHLKLENDEGTSITVQIPSHVENGIGTYFNRAVVESQAFSRKLKALKIDPNKKPTDEQELALRTWLANGMEKALPEFLKEGKEYQGAIYHLTDNLWIIPALVGAAESGSQVEIVYDAHTSKKDDGTVVPSPNQTVIDDHADEINFYPRTKTKIMHNKFIVKGKMLGAKNPKPESVTQGSANYTTEGLTEQANLIHTFASPELARFYLDRALFLQNDPALKETSDGADWSDWVTVGDAGVRVIFSPEPKDQRESLDRIVEAIHSARSSVIFCLFDPTDKPIRDAAFAASDNGKLMFGLVNRIAHEEPGLSDPPRADELAALELYHRSKENKDTIGAEFFGKGNVPAGFELERNLFPGSGRPPFPPVIIHHKFVVIDAEGENPIVFSGSQNLSKSSLSGNDENLLEIRCKRMARIYLAEFFRLYEHYRARAAFISRKTSENAGESTFGKFELAPDRKWANNHYKPGTPEFKARVRLLAD